MIADTIGIALAAVTIDYYYKKYYRDKEYKTIDQSEYELLIGYNINGPIKVNMQSNPHLLVTGLSGQGKSRCIRAMLSNLQATKKADIILMNVFNEDYKGIQARVINNEESILKTIINILTRREVHSKPLYLVIEELGTLKSKELNESIKELLRVGRHYNIFLVGVIQIATKEDCKFKSYFNARLTFRQLDDASYRVVLGTGIGEKILNKREFALVSDDLYFGKTYIIN